jgi:hypothetical protein
MCRKLVGLIGIAASVLLLGGATAPDDPDFRRLAQLPPEVRKRAAEQLAEAQALPSGELAALRRLDAQLNAAPAEERVRLLDELRRYALWVASLPADQQALLANAPNDGEWRALVSKIRAGQDPPEAVRKDGTVFLRHMVEFGNTSVALETALLVGWRALGEEGRRALPDPKKERDKFRGRLFEEARKAVEAPEAPKDDAPESSFLARVLRRMDRVGPLDELIDRKAAVRAELQPRAMLALRLRVGEMSHLEHFPPHKVAPERLDRFFAQEIPPWLKEDFGDLSPEAARLMLAVMYREVYRYPAEMPDPAREEHAPAGKPAKPIGPTF